MATDLTSVFIILQSDCNEIANVSRGLVIHVISNCLCNTTTIIQFLFYNFMSYLRKVEQFFVNKRD